MSIYIYIYIYTGDVIIIIIGNGHSELMSNWPCVASCRCGEVVRFFPVLFYWKTVPLCVYIYIYIYTSDVIVIVTGNGHGDLKLNWPCVASCTCGEVGYIHIYW